MRRIIMFNRVTVNGYFAGSEGNLEWVVPDETLDRAATERMPEADAILFGRRTYEMFEGFWRHALDGSSTAPDPHGPGRSTAMQAMARWINDSVKIVFSHKLKNVTWKNSRLLKKVDRLEVESIKKNPGKDIMLFGSGSIVSQLTDLGLIDEYQFVLSPTILAGGRPLFTDLSTLTNLRLVETKPFPSGNVLLRYVPASG